MPPRAGRGARNTRRGPGRGKAQVPELDPRPPFATPTVEELASQSTIIASHSPENIAVNSPKAQSSEHIASQSSPSSSPATVPTETPAPTPVRPPLQKLEGLRSSTRDGVAGSRGRGKSAPESKFRPRIIRRDRTEREILEKEERARLAANAANAERTAVRVRGRGGKGRGDAMGRGASLGRGVTLATASGPFGVPPERAVSLERRPGVFAPGGGPKRQNGAISTQSDGGSGGVGAPESSAIKFKSEKSSLTRQKYSESGANIEIGETESTAKLKDPQYPDDGEHLPPRVDIEFINLITDDENDEPDTTTRGKGKATLVPNSNKGGLKPIRLYREEHKERVTTVNIESSITNLLTEDEKPDTEVLLVDERVLPRAKLAKKDWKGVYQDPDTIQVKSEPGLAMPHRSASKEPTQGAAPPPTGFKRSGRKYGTTAAPTEVEPDQARPKKSGPRRPSQKIPFEPVIQTEEDRAEYHRHLEDVSILANELGGLQTRTGYDRSTGKNRDVEGDVDMVGGEDEQVDRKEGRLYLFQFPPVLPRLFNPEKEKVKNETETNVEITGSKGNIDLTGDAEVKTEEEVVIKAEPGTTVNLQPQKIVSEEGWIGKLIVRESGRVELSWGGISMVIGRGVDASFLSTVVVTNDKDQQGGEEGEAMGMGKVMGKFVVQPDWEKMC